MHNHIEQRTISEQKQERRTIKKKERPRRHRKRRNVEETSEPKIEDSYEGADRDKNSGESINENVNAGANIVDNAKTSKVGVSSIMENRQGANIPADYEEKGFGKFSRFPVLSTGKLYVQARDNFKAIRTVSSDKRRNTLASSPKIQFDLADNEQFSNEYLPITVAILLQRFFNTIGFISRGFLAGMALTHFLMIHIFFSDSSKVPLYSQDFSWVSRLHSNLFSCLIVFCLTSVLDKVTLPLSFDRQCLREVVGAACNKTLLTVPLYSVGLILHLLSVQIDQEFHLLSHHDGNSTDGTIRTDEFDAWRKIVMSKDITAMLAWFLGCFDTQSDAFLYSLEAMAKI